MFRLNLGAGKKTIGLFAGIHFPRERDGGWAGEPDILKVLRAKATGIELGKSQSARQNNSGRFGGHSPPLPWSRASPVPSGTTRKESRHLVPSPCRMSKRQRQTEICLDHHTHMYVHLHTYVWRYLYVRIDRYIHVYMNVMHTEPPPGTVGMFTFMMDIGSGCSNHGQLYVMSSMNTHAQTHQPLRHDH